MHKKEWEKVLVRDRVSHAGELAKAKRSILELEKVLVRIDQELEFVRTTDKEDLTFEEVILRDK